MARRTRAASLSVAAAVIFVFTMPLSPAVAAEKGSYEHVWSVQTLASGTLGETRQQVVASEVTLELEGGRYLGRLVYGDLVGVSTDEGLHSQESEIVLDLTGAPVAGGTAAGGTFSGIARLTVRPAASLDHAVDEAIRNESGRVFEYAVSGHWGAEVAEGIAKGELLYELATLSKGDPQSAEGISWFNRASLSAPGGIGEAQSFTAPVLGAAADPANGDGAPGENKGADDDRGEAVDGEVSEGEVRLTAWDYIRRGFSGERLETIPTVADSLAEDARSLLDARPSGATPLPGNAVAVDVHLPGAYLDAKNRAAGLLGQEGRQAQEADRLRDAAAEARRAVPGIPAVPGGDDAGLVWAQRAIEALQAGGGAEGAQDLIGELGLVRAGSDRETVLALRARAFAALAVASPESYGSVSAGAFSVAEEVRSSELAGGALADGVLAAFGDPRAPASAVDVERFERVESLDVTSAVAATGKPGAETGEATQAPLPAAATISAGGRLTYLTAEGPRQAAPDVWRAYRRADGAAYWLAGDGSEVALTDGSVRGWAFTLDRAALVSSERVGRWLAVYPLG